MERNGVEQDPDLEKTADEALTKINTAVTKCCDSSGIDVDRLIQTVNKRSAMVSTDLASALGYVGKRFVLLFDTVNKTLQAT